MKTNIQKRLNIGLCIAIVMILAGSTVSYGMDMKLWSERDKKIAAAPGVIDLEMFSRRVELPHIYAGTSENNPLLWIVQKASDKQLDLFVRMNKEKSNFKIIGYGDDLDAYQKLPRHVKSYLSHVFGYTMQ